jgi:DnaJ-class molecular chaperone
MQSKGGMPDITQIMKIAQQVASQIEQPDELKSGKVLTEKDMTNVMSKITKQVASKVTPDMLQEVAGEKPVDVTDVKPKKEAYKGPSKISLDSKKEKSTKNRVVEVDSEEDSDDEDPTNPRTKDMVIQLSVKLEDLYTGIKKKVAIRRQKIEKDGSYEEEKKKLSVKIEPGMIEEQVLRFNHMADEKQGYETGDVVIQLEVDEHKTFIRDGNNLLMEQTISFSDSFKPEFYLTHLDGSVYKINGDPINVFDDEEELKKIPNMGMPILGEPGKYGDLFIKFKCFNDVKLTETQLDKLKEIFPSKIVIPEALPSEVETLLFETVTESDLEFLEDSDSDSDSDYETETETEESD